MNRLSIKLIFILFLVVSITGLNYNLRAQSLASANLATINIDDISDEDILGYISQAEESGYTQAQLEAFARQRGMRESEISKLRRRIESLSSGLNQNQGLVTQRTVEGRQELVMTEGDVFGKLSFSDNSVKLTETQGKIYGYDLFQSENLTFAPNLNIPTPQNYILGPGDEIHIDLWGATQVAATYKVSNEGTIRPENLRPIYVNGMSINAFEDMIDDRLAAIYSGLKGDNPTIFYQVSLGNIRTINVSIVGEVNNPGNYALNSLSTVYTALYAAGGPTENGTFRYIRLIRDNELFAELDIYEFLQTGVKKEDKRLRDGDVIIIRPYEKRVELQGEVKRPGFFEVKEGESFNDILKLASGFSNTAYRSLITARRSGLAEREVVDVPLSNFEKFLPEDGDVYRVSPILDRYSNRVQIEGAVFREGEYQLTEGLTLKQLIEKADGLRGDVFLTRATIYRTNEDFSQLIIPIDLSKLLNNEEEDLLLQKEDLVRISSIYDLKEEFYVQISGEVSEGGVYPFFNKMTVEDLIVLSGGLTEGASGVLVEISRRNKNSDLNSAAEIIKLEVDKSLRLDLENRDILLEPFDQVYIRKTPGYTVQKQVSIEGEVSTPGVYSISRKDERISDLVRRAQGMTQFAYPEGAILIRRTEFSVNKSNDQVSQEFLQQLRKKLLSEDSDLKNISQERLIERLDKIENRGYVNANADDIVGSRIKKELIEDVAAQDSLVRNVELNNQEPVALELMKILEEPGSKYDFLLRDGDIISIPGRLETVRVAGEVTSPLNLRYDKSYSFRDYMDQSGGFLQTAKKGRSYVLYPNGKRKGTKRFLFIKFYPKIQPGSTLFITRKPEREGINFQAIIAAAGSVATLALVVERLSQTN